METKLEIVGPYTPEHEGPFCTRDGDSVEMKFRDGRGDHPLGGYVGKNPNLTVWEKNGRYYPDDSPDHEYDLMNAREVPAAREFWINEYTDMIGVPYASKDAARDGMRGENYIRTIHVREVLPGDEA